MESHGAVIRYSSIESESSLYYGQYTTHLQLHLRPDIQFLGIVLGSAAVLMISILERDV